MPTKYKSILRLKMKTRASRYFFAVILCTLLFTACEKTEDTGPNTSDRDKFLGSWSGSSTGTGGTRNFNMTVTASNSASDQIILNNFDGVGTGNFIAANISGSSLSLVSTLVGSDRYDGTGSISGSTLSFTFTIDDGQTIENRSATATK